MLRRVIADVLYLRGNGLLQQGSARRAAGHLGLAARVGASNANYYGAAAHAAQKAGDIDASRTTATPRSASSWRRSGAATCGR